MSPLLSLALIATLADDPPQPKSVEHALTYLRGAQRDDGHWPTKNAMYESAVTSLAGLAFLSAGHVPGRGPEGAALTKAVRALLKSQRPDGIFASRYATWVMYQQGLSVLFLSEALAGADVDLARDIRPALEKGVAVIFKAQSKAGGWRYTAEPKDEDVSVTSATLLALKAASLAGITVPQEAVDKALAYVRKCRDKNARSFAYKPGTGSVGSANAAAAGLALALWAGPMDPAIKPALDFVHGNRGKGVRPYPSYTTRTVVEFTVLAGGAKPDTLRTEMLAALAKKQREDGSFPTEVSDSNYGPAYCTAEAVLALTADQRRLRVFQAPDRKEEPGKNANANATKGEAPLISVVTGSIQSLAMAKAASQSPNQVSRLPPQGPRRQSMSSHSAPENPLRRLEDWEEFVEHCYPAPAQKARADYRNYDDPARDTVRAFYRLNHRYQTHDFVLDKKRTFLKLDRRQMTVLEALDFLDTLVDDSDPDIDLSQREHLLQTAEAIRADGHEDWFVLTGLIHDLGKVLCLFGEPQWAVVGDTFPVGCAYSDRIVYPEFFADNPDSHDPQLQTPCGVYAPGGGLRNVHLSWGHDEYLYHVVKERMPQPALYMIRYHSFYAWHREGQYGHLLDAHDRQMLPWVRKFNPYDLYSKCPERPNWDTLGSYYIALIDKYLPGKLCW